MRFNITLILIFIYSLLIPLPKSSAAVENLYDYPSEALYQSIFRFIILDKHFSITKDNPEMGLLTFIYNEGGVKDNSSTVEIIKDATGTGKSKVRIHVPSLSDETVKTFMDQLNVKIQSDFNPPARDEQTFNYSYEKLFSSIYRYLAIEKKFDINDMNKEKGIIFFTYKEIDLPPEKSHCEIIKMPQGGFKVRMVIPSLSSSSLKVYLNGISDKLKRDYQKED